MVLHVKLAIPGTNDLRTPTWISATVIRCF